MKHQPRSHPVLTALLRLLVLLPIGAGMMSLASLLCWYAAEVLFSDTSSWQRAYRLYDNPVSSIILPCVFSVAALAVTAMTASRRRITAVLIGFAWGIPVLPVAGFTIVGGILLWPLVYAYPIFGLAQALLVLMFRLCIIDLFSRGLAVPDTLK